jgi:uncharacterized membrane protein
MIKLVYGIFLTVCATILVHIAIIFLIPRLIEPQIVSRLQTMNQTREPLVFSGRDKEPGVSGLDPFFKYRVCFYDLDEGPFQLVSSGDVPFFSASLVAENGDVLFSITDRQTINRVLNIEVRPTAEQQRLSQNINDNTDFADAVPVFVPNLKGYAVVRAFVPDKSWNEIADNFLSEIICQSGSGNS